MIATDEALRCVVLDVNVYLDAVQHDETAVLGDPPSLARIPSLPPRCVHPALHVLGVIRDGGWALATSDHIEAMIDHKLAEWNWTDKSIDDYLNALVDLAELSGGGYYDNVPRTQFDSKDDEDNRILDLAHHVDAALLVSNDNDLLCVGRGAGWKGRPIITPDQFAKRAEVASRN